MASNTWEGLSDPDEHAEPLEAQTPWRSRAARRAMLSEPATVKETVLESRAREEPRRTTPSREETKDAKRLVRLKRES